MIFIEEIADLLGDVSIYPGAVLVLGDSNLHFESNNAPGVTRIQEILAENNLLQCVNQPTNTKCHMLDLVISQSADSMISEIRVEPSGISDQHIITFCMGVTQPTPN